LFFLANASAADFAMELFTKNTNIVSGGLYYKHVTIVNDDSGVVNKLETSLTDDTRVVIYDCCMFKEQATGVFVIIINLQHTLKYVF
jgi:hypothetical protein